MKYKIKQSGKTQKTLEVHLSRDIVSGELDKIYQEIARKAALPGFRKGKAPLELIKKHFKQQATDDAVKNLVLDSFRKAASESEIDILGYPQISDVQFHEEKGMSYKATVNIRPGVKLKAYKGLKLKKADKKVEDADIEATINSLREMSAKFSQKEGGAKKGDYVVCTVDCAVEGQRVEKKENAWLYVGDDAFIPGNELEGLKAGDEKDVSKVLPKDYSKKEVAGKDATFHLKINEVKEKNLPELNDEFASTAGNFKSVAELKNAVKENLRRRNEAEAQRELEGQAIGILNKNAVFDTPQFLVDRQLERLVGESKNRLKREQGLSDDELKSMEAGLKERLKDEAVREVRTFFILEEIARCENITVEDREIGSALTAVASSAGRPVEEVRKYYRENDLIDNLREDIRQRKALDIIIKNADIK